MLSQLLMPSQLLLLMLSQLPLLSQDMDMVMDMAMDMVIMDTMARDLLSPDMDIMAMDMDMDMVMDMAMVMDTMDKQTCCSSLEFSTNEVDLYRSSQKKHNFHHTEINIKKRKK